MAEVCVEMELRFWGAKDIQKSSSGQFCAFKSLISSSWKCIFFWKISKKCLKRKKIQNCFSTFNKKNDEPVEEVLRLKNESSNVFSEKKSNFMLQNQTFLKKPFKTVQLSINSK